MNYSSKMARRAAGLATSVLLIAAPAGAIPITFTASSGNLSSKVTFNVSGTNLLVTLTNTSTSDVMVPSQVLAAVFFDLGGNPTLTPTSALLSSGSIVHFGPSNGGNVGGEWAYAAGLSGAPLGANRGISSSGFGLFGAGNFGGPNLQGPNSVDGLQYGLTSAGDNPATGNTPVTGGNALIQNSVDFILSGLPAGFNLNVSDVSFQYGTALSDTSTSPNLPAPVPEPASLLLLGSGLLGLAWKRSKPAKR